MNTESTFRAEFRRTDDEGLDAKLSPLEDQLHTLSQIQNFCKRYRVRARVFDAATGRVVADLDRDGKHVSVRY